MVSTVLAPVSEIKENQLPTLPDILKDINSIKDAEIGDEPSLTGEGFEVPLAFPALRGNYNGGYKYIITISYAEAIKLCYLQDYQEAKKTDPRKSWNRKISPKKVNDIQRKMSKEGDRLNIIPLSTAVHPKQIIFQPLDFTFPNLGEKIDRYYLKEAPEQMGYLFILEKLRITDGQHRTGAFKKLLLLAEGKNQEDLKNTVSLEIVPCENREEGVYLFICSNLGTGVDKKFLIFHSESPQNQILQTVLESIKIGKSSLSLARLVGPATIPPPKGKMKMESLHLIEYTVFWNILSKVFVENEVSEILVEDQQIQLLKAIISALRSSIPLLKWCFEEFPNAENPREERQRLFLKLRAFSFVINGNVVGGLSRLINYIVEGFAQDYKLDDLLRYFQFLRLLNWDRVETNHDFTSIFFIDPEGTLVTRSASNKAGDIVFRYFRELFKLSYTIVKKFKLLCTEEKAGFFSTSFEPASLGLQGYLIDFRRVLWDQQEGKKDLDLVSINDVADDKEQFLDSLGIVNVLEMLFSLDSQDYPLLESLGISKLNTHENPYERMGVYQFQGSLLEVLQEVDEIISSALTEMNIEIAIPELQALDFAD